MPSLTEALCLEGDDSTDGSATALDDDGKDVTKGEDLGEPWDPNTPHPPPHPPRPPSLSESSWEQTRLKAKSSCGLWEEGWSISHHRDGAALWYGVQSRLNGTSTLNSMVSQGDSKL